ncbi:unnamed protein product [Brassica oleracea]
MLAGVASCLLSLCSSHFLSFFLLPTLFSRTIVSLLFVFTLVLERQSDLHVFLRLKRTGRCYLSFPALRWSSAMEARASSVCRLYTTGSDIFSGNSRRSSTISTTHCRCSYAVAALESDSSVTISLTHIPVIRRFIQGWDSHLLESSASVLRIFSDLSQSCSTVSLHLLPGDGLFPDNSMVTLMGLVGFTYYYLCVMGFCIEIFLVGLGLLFDSLYDRESLACVWCSGSSFGKKNIVPSLTSFWESQILLSSLRERSLLPSSLLEEIFTPPLSLYMRGEPFPVSKPVLLSSFMERVLKSSLALALRAFIDHSMVLGLKKVDSKSAILQISIYRSLEDWISLVEDVVAACVLSTASDSGSRSLNMFSYACGLASLFTSQELVYCCVFPLILSRCILFYVVASMWLSLSFYDVRFWNNIFFMECNHL